MRRSLLLLAAAFAAGPALAQIPLGLTPSRIDFNDYRGTGFAPTPAAGQLDSDNFVVYGLSDGPTAQTGSPAADRPAQFGETRTTGDYARGESTGNVSGGTGGIYAFQTETDDYALGAQPTGSDFNPGLIYIRYQNTTGTTLHSVSVQGEFKVYNDSPRSTALAMYVFPDVVIDGTGLETSRGTPIVVAITQTPAAAVLPAAWATIRFAGTAEGIDLSPGETFYVQLRSQDASGTGNRDEVAIDDIEVSAVSETIGTTLSPPFGTGAENVAGWRMLAPILDGSTVADLADDNLVQGVVGSFPSAGANLLLNYDGSGTSAGFVNPAGVSTATPLVSGKGFIWYFYNGTFATSQTLPDNVGYTGAIQTNDVLTAFDLNADRLYLAGNPFNQSFQLSGMSVPAGYVLSDAASVWSPSAGAGAGSYVTLSRAANDQVARGQGFFAELSTQLSAPPNVTLTYAAASQTTTGLEVVGRSADFFRAGFTLDGLTASGAHTYDESAYAVFAEGATDGYDLFDGTKLPTLASPSGEIAFVGERDGQTQYRAQESRPIPTEAPATLSLATRVLVEPGTFTLRWPGLVNLPEAWAATLTDVTTNDVVDMRQADHYDFAATPADDWDARFEITVAPRGAVASEGSPAGEAIVRSVVPNPTRGAAHLAVSAPAAERVTVRVFDTLGRLVATPFDAMVAGGAETSVALPEALAPGTYVVRVTGDSFSATRRLTVVR